MLTIYTFVLLGSALASCGDQNVEMVFLQDGTSSFSDLISTMKDKVVDLVEQLNYESVRFGLTAFSDKPIPFRGVGYGRGVSPSEGEIDYCYRRISPLSESADDLAAGFDVLSDSKAAGGDFPENPYEGMIYAAQDPALQWSKSESIAKFIVLVTDDIPHYKGDGQLGIDWWNKGNPHFMDPEFINSPSFYEVDTPAIYPSKENSESYTRLIDLKNKGENISVEEKDEFNKLMSLLGPETYPNLKEHDGAFEHYVRCQDFEYPDVSLLKETLKKNNIIPLVLVAPPSQVSSESQKVCEARGINVNSSNPDELYKCMSLLYQEDLNGLDLFAVEAFENDAGAFIKAVKNIVESITEKMDCEDLQGDASILEACTGSHGTGTIAGVGVGCATAGAGVVAAAFYLCMKPFNRGTSVDRSCDFDPLTKYDSPKDRDQTQVLKVEDFA